jgi:hypothetical protein
VTQQFAEGNSISVGRQRGAKNYLARMVQQQIQDDLYQHGEAANPVVILLKFARDESLKPGLRIQAAALAAKFIAPKLLQVNVDVDVDVNNADQHARLAGDPAFRDAAELIMEKLAEDAKRRGAMWVDTPIKLLPAPEGGS